MSGELTNIDQGFDEWNHWIYWSLCILQNKSIHYSNLQSMLQTKFIFLQNSKIENLWRSTGPLTIYSALFAAPITHYFYNILQRFFGPNLVAKVLVDRLVFCPIFVFFTLYIIDRLQVCYCNILALRRCCTGTAKHRTAHLRRYCTDNPSAPRSR